MTSQTLKSAFLVCLLVTVSAASLEESRDEEVELSKLFKRFRLQDINRSVANAVKAIFGHTHSKQIQNDENLAKKQNSDRVTDDYCAPVTSLTKLCDEFTSPGYPHVNYARYANCSWNITVPQGMRTCLKESPDFLKIRLPASTKRVKLEILDMDIEPCGEQQKCECDRLLIYDFTPSGRDELDRRCGRMGPKTYLSTSNQLLVRLTTDYTVQAKGFAARYVAVTQDNLKRKRRSVRGEPCSEEGAVLTDKNGVIASPGYDGRRHYGHNLSCKWLIKAEPGKKTVLTSEFFHLQVFPNCGADYVEIFSVSTSGTQSLGKFCGVQGDINLITDGDMLVRFVSDGSGVSTGFKFYYATLDAEEDRKETYHDLSDLYEGNTEDEGRYLRSLTSQNWCPWKVTDVSACEDKPVTLTCSQGHVIRVTTANYGRTVRDKCGTYLNTNCRSPTSLKIVKERCHDQSSCTVPASNRIFGDPCPGVVKYLAVEYYCQTTDTPTLPPPTPSEPTPPVTSPEPTSQPVTSALACEYRSVTLSCSQGHVIRVTMANYGRTERDKCGSYSNTNCRESKSLQIVRERCQDQSSCTVPANNRIFGDPCHGVMKYLVVEYYCQTTETPTSPPPTPSRPTSPVTSPEPTSQPDTSASACENKPVTLSCSQGHVIRVTMANYGRTERDKCGTYSNTNCRSPSSLQIVRERCQDQTSCTVVATNHIFGDPCPGVVKYLAVNYHCQMLGVPSPPPRNGGPSTLSKEPTPPVATTVAPSVAADKACSGIAQFPSNGYVLNSKNYPSNYSNDLTCKYRIVAPPNKLIELTFLDLDIEPSTCCTFDSVAAYDNLDSSVSSSRLTKLCSSDVPSDVIRSTGNWMFIVFKSDFSVTGRGFKARFDYVDKPGVCAADEISCLNGKCVKGIICDSINDCSDSSDEADFMCTDGFMKTYGGNGGGASCVFPFVYKGRQYLACTKVNHDKPWCATTDNYDKDKKWGNCAGCGKPFYPPLVPTKRVVGGQEAVPHSFPWMVSLVSNGEHYCGGSLIRTDVVMTAAHCVYRQQASHFSVVAGEHLLTATGVLQQSVPVEKIICHEHYNDVTVDNDVALLKLATPVVPSPAVSLICLPEATEVPEGMTAIVSGWGNTEGTADSTRLQQVAVPVVTNEECRSSYEPQNITDNMLCAGFKDGGKDSCQGDSGGPLIVKSDDGRWKQIGIVSWGRGCADVQHYGVYARVQRFLDWINGKFNDGF